MNTSLSVSFRQLAVGAFINDGLHNFGGTFSAFKLTTSSIKIFRCKRSCGFVNAGIQCRNLIHPYHSAAEVRDHCF
jgi:hypothetical protein